MKKLFGNTNGLKANQLRQLENFYRRRIPFEYIVTPELARDLSILSHEIRRQIGLLIDRAGKISAVIVGNHHRIVIPELSEQRSSAGRLKGVRCVHTHLKDEPLTKDDLTDLSLLRLDLMAVITTAENGRPHQVHVAHILPKGSSQTPYQILPPLEPSHLDIDCLELIMAIESEISQDVPLFKADEGIDRALLVSVTTSPKRKAKDSMAELEELARSSGIQVAGSLIQYRDEVDSRILMGSGKLNELTILAMEKGATLIIFDQELNPSQIRAITDRIELKVIDRTQLILDIFAQRAITREGKLQVELAQLEYLLPRLIVKNTAMSRLTGGIGGRGPGETKLEINRRRVRDKITRLEKEILLVRNQRKQQRAKRSKKGLPVISIIGYTNAGKSTLLNTLTHSNVLAEDRLFATLDPSSRRLKFPKDVEVIITDTVGFIENLPKELMAAFRATLEELQNADLLLHVIDISNPRYEDQVIAVEKILDSLDLNHIPMICALNKQDLVGNDIMEKALNRLKGIAISAKDASTLIPLIQRMQMMVQPIVSQPTSDGNCVDS